MTATRTPTKSAFRVTVWCDGLGNEHTVNAATAERAEACVRRYYASEGIAVESVDVAR